MTKTGLLFAGQGAQKLGMARDLYDNFDSVKKTYDEASEILGYDLRQLIDQDAEQLAETKYTQPAILTTSVAILRLLDSQGVSYDVVAGLSLGEYSALVASGSLSFADFPIRWREPVGVSGPLGRSGHAVPRLLPRGEEPHLGVEEGLGLERTEPEHRATGLDG